MMLLGGFPLSFVVVFLIFIYLAKNFWGKKSCWSNAPCALLWVHFVTSDMQYLIVYYKEPANEQHQA